MAAISKDVRTLWRDGQISGVQLQLNPTKRESSNPIIDWVIEGETISFEFEDGSKACWNSPLLGKLSELSVAKLRDWLHYTDYNGVGLNIANTFEFVCPADLKELLFGAHYELSIELARILKQSVSVRSLLSSSLPVWKVEDGSVIFQDPVRLSVSLSPVSQNREGYWVIDSPSTKLENLRNGLNQSDFLSRLKLVDQLRDLVHLMSLLITASPPVPEEEDEVPAPTYIEEDSVVWNGRKIRPVLRT